MKKLLIFLLAILPLTLFAQEHIQFLGHYIDEPNFVQTLISEGKVKINKWGIYESKIEGYDSFIVFNGERKINSITFTQPRSNKWETLKKTKKGEKMADIKPLVKEMKYWVKDGELVINTLIATGSRENLSADLLSRYVSEKIDNINKDSFVSIKREEMYLLKNNKYVPLCKAL